MNAESMFARRLVAASPARFSSLSARAPLQETTRGFAKLSQAAKAAKSARLLLARENNRKAGARMAMGAMLVLGGCIGVLCSMETRIEPKGSSDDDVEEPEAE